MVLDQGEKNYLVKLKRMRRILEERIQGNEVEAPQGKALFLLRQSETDAVLVG